MEIKNRGRTFRRNENGRFSTTLMGRSILPTFGGMGAVAEEGHNVDIVGVLATNGERKDEIPRRMHLRRYLIGDLHARPAHVKHTHGLTRRIWCQERASRLNLRKPDIFFCVYSIFMK